MKIVVHRSVGIRILFQAAALLVCQDKTFAQCAEAANETLEMAEHANQIKEVIELTHDLNNYTTTQYTILPPGGKYSEAQLQQKVQQLDPIPDVKTDPVVQWLMEHTR